ncbi:MULTISPECIES: DinB family protein [Sphingobacterium]|uniref:DinB family protein n=1 Tax=Sphingobacterium TaxID=28453 RepID=UPI0013D9DDA2|nr:MULTISPECIES: DinB family protein [unclassified Sphingobacterium]
MENTFKFIIQTRRAFIQLIDSLTIEQLNEIPTGFNNNIIWNFGHIVVVTPALCYLRSGVSTDTAMVKYLKSYVKGSKPTYTVTQEEVDDLKRLAITTIEQIRKDYNAGVFKEIIPFATDTYKETLSAIEEIIQLSAGHDNLHYGYAIAQNRIINNK